MLVEEWVERACWLINVELSLETPTGSSNFWEGRARRNHNGYGTKGTGQGSVSCSLCGSEIIAFDRKGRSGHKAKSEGGCQGVWPALFARTFDRFEAGTRLSSSGCCVRTCRKRLSRRGTACLQWGAGHKSSDSRPWCTEFSWRSRSFSFGKPVSLKAHPGKLHLNGRACLFF